MFFAPVEISVEGSRTLGLGDLGFKGLGSWASGATK